MSSLPAAPPEGASCPRERHPLTHRNVVGIEFFFCETCHGLWFGPEALFELGFHVAQGGRAPRSLASRRPAFLEGTARCLCPEHPLMKTKEKDGVTLDECPVCRGIWLDGGEVEAILRSHPAVIESRQIPSGEPGSAHGVSVALNGIGVIGDVIGVILEVIGGLGDLS